LRLLLYILAFFTFTNTLTGQWYFVYFKDKAAFNKSIATELLSQRAIDRRTLQNITLDLSDMPVKKEYLDSIIILGATVYYTSKWFNGVLINTSSEIANTISQKSYVSNLHNLQTSINYGGAQSFDDNYYGKAWQNVDFLGINGFHKLGYTGKGKMISVFDAGFIGINTLSQFGHLSINKQITNTYNFITNTSNVFSGDGHGTEVSSLLAAYQEGNFVGIAPEANYAFYVTENIATETINEEYYWLFAAEKADSAGTDLINSSLGYYNFDTPFLSHTFSELNGNTTIISKAAKMASNKGILVINSAGNSNNSSDWPYINFPGDVEEVLTVGAIDYNNNVANFSCRGPIATALFKPELVAPGVGIEILDDSGNQTSSTGTSFSTPSICGLACLVWCVHPSFTAQEVKAFLIKNSSQFTNPDQSTGYGYPLITNILGIDNLSTKTLTKVIYIDLQGKIYQSPPTTSGFWIEKSIYLDGHTESKKIYLF
jgi:serine protease AprX